MSQGERPHVPSERTLDDLYAEIPRVPCVVGCRDCCTAIPVATVREAEAFDGAAISIENSPERKVDRYIAMPEDGSKYCVKSTPAEERHGCSIHDKRPFVCRLFGTVSASEVPYNDSAKHLICPRGRKPTNPLTAMQANSMMREYFEIAARMKSESLARDDANEAAYDNEAADASRR